MANTLDFARTSASRRWVGWVACGISVLLALGGGFDAVRLAFYFRRPIGIAAGQRDPYWFVDKQMSMFGTPLIFCVAAVGCVICWRRNTGKWLSVAALVTGVVCWIGAVLSYP